MRTYTADEFLTLRTLGQGAQGPVVAVRHTPSGLEFAQKRAGGDARREAILLDRLRHPHVLALEGVGRDQGGAFFLTPIAEGDLADALRGDPSRVAPLLADVLRGLAFLHSRGFVHGDLKPSNVLVVRGRAVLADLGLARLEGELESGGTPAYMSPERLRGAPASASADLYAIGATFAVALGAPLPTNPVAGPVELARWLSTQADRDVVAAAPLLRVLVESDPSRRPANARVAARRLALLTGEASYGLETADSARAYLRPTTLARRAASMDELRAATGRPGVVALRAAPGAGGTRLLEELALDVDCALVDGRTAETLPPDALVLLDDADLASERLHATLVDLQRRTLENEAQARVVALVRPGSELDRRLAAEAVRTIDLPPLDADALVDLVRQVFPDRGDPRPFAARLHASTGGAPGRAVALLASLASSGQVLPGSLVDADVPGPEVLEGVSAGSLPAALAERLDAALTETPPARLLAAILTVARRPLDPDLAREALQRLVPRADFAAALARLRDLRVASDKAVVLDGEQTRAVVEGLLAQTERRSARFALGEVLRPRGSESGDDTALLALADAALLRGDEADLAHAAKVLFSRSFAREAAALLRAGGVVDPASRLLLARCLAQLAELDAAVAEARQASAEGAPGAALFGAEIHVRKGDYATAARELEAAKAAGASGVDLDALLARALALTGHHERAAAICAQALAAGATGAAAADLANTSALAAYFKGDLEDAERRYQDAVARARELLDKAREGNATNGLGLVAQRRGRFDEARALYEAALVLAEASGDRMRVGASLMNLGTVLQELGRTREAAQQYRRAAVVQRLAGERVQSARARSNLANLLLHVGRLDDSRAAADEARVIAEAAGAGVVKAYAVMLVGEAAQVGGSATEAAVRLTEARDLFAQLGNVSEALEAETLLARLSLQQGDRSGAARLALDLAGRARARNLDLHEAKALVTAADALDGEENQEVASGFALRALGLARPSRRIDLLWRIEAALARTSADEEGRRYHAGRAQALFEEAAAKVDPEDREAFANRPDRARIRGGIAGAAREASFAAKGAASRLSRLLSINRRLGAERNLKALLEEIVDQAVELCGAERGFVLLAAEKSGGPLSVMIARNIDGESLAKGQLKVSRSIAERVLVEGEPVLTLDAQQDERYQQQLSVAALKLRSVLCVPLRFQGSTLGALYLDNRFRSRAFGEDDFSVLEAFADQAAIAMAQVRALEEARQHRELAEQARTEIEALNRRLADRVEAQEAEIARARREADEQRLAVARTTFADIVGDSAPMQRLLRQLERVAATDLTVLVTGESGTGKELVAKALFSHGPRRKKAFVSVNCGAFNEGVLESELFGHVRGAFTGADRERDGLFQVADGGTLFLDEVGEMSPAMQVKLLRALQEGEVRKVGGKDSVHVDVRVIAATNRDLARAIREGRFREDLYYRLNVVTLLIPPLRERLDDLPQLCARLLSELPVRDGRAYRLSSEALGLLSRYAWPGNVRELRATLHNAALFGETEVLTAADFANKPELARPTPSRSDAPANLAGRPIEDLEAEAIRRTLELTKGNKSETARMLGIDRKTLYNKMTRLRLRPSGD